MGKTKNIEKQCTLLRCFFDSDEDDKTTTLPIVFHKEKINLLNTNINPRRFITDQPIQDGQLLGYGGMKRVYHIQSQAVFLIPCHDINRLEQIIDEEVSISHQMALLGLCTQTLNKDYISIYDPGDQNYYDYPCMVADSFSTLSLQKNIEIYDTKNRYRFGSKYKLYSSDEECFDININRKIFLDVLDDLALLLYLGFEVNEQDSFNLAFMPAKDGQSSTVRLFLYDFSSKYYVPKIGPTPIDTVPEVSKIKRILKSIIRNALEADHAANLKARPITTPEYIYDFLSEIYPKIENEFVDTIKMIIAKRIKTKKQFEERVIPALFQSTQLKEACRLLGFYKSPKREDDNMSKSNVNSEVTQLSVTVKST
ncbi:hypothetical protein OQJ02_14560 [Legionella sp. PATHC032]|uniref:hypothetical protein n=1 Tax=Legionella sp. PATHC032 TaxID=2992039 RepID=UPI001B2DF6CF|nr:hypothetical protein [Legionella sp. PATHC032]MCW8422848.1 hypothetical protein [Legionella sp. PATHC032]HAZ7572843.1 hypothetical protein [Legionella pneumophila]HBA1636107.1 hypothetical protein [Legionella pneumophila]